MSPVITPAVDTAALLAHARQAGRAGGVNLCGYLRTESGVGAAGRGYARALQAAGVPVALVDLSAISGNRAQDDSLTLGGAQPIYDVNLVCVDVDLHYAMLAQMGEDFLADRYTIGVWWWELPRFPEKWADRFAYYDEIWTGTSFVAEALAPVAPLPVVHMPPALAMDPRGDRARGRQRLDVSDEMVYLYIFDVHSHLARKNPHAAVEAFVRAFAADERAKLVLKSVNGDADHAGMAGLYAQIAAYGREHQIAVYDGYWPAAALHDLMAACDAYLSLHRAEGAGLTIADALIQGKPVIATGWSGNMDFMTPFNSYPVAYDLVTLQENAGPYRAGEEWAEPCVDDAAAQMVAVYTDRVTAQARGSQAQADMAATFAPAVVGERTRQRLDAIALRRSLPAFRAQVQTRYAQYRQLPERLAQLMAAAIPAGATVLMISKGDAALVDWERWQGWHFPQDQDGAYAGYYPADSAEAVAHLEQLRGKGADYLVVPSSAAWWFDHYAGFKAHLDRGYRRVAQEPQTGVIYALSRRKEAATTAV